MTKEGKSKLKPKKAGAKKAAIQPLRVVYLVGAGATQSEVSFRGAKPVNVLMRDSGSLEGVATRILNRAGTDWKLATGEQSDIEKLISLLVGCGIDSFARKAEEMRQSYFDEIRFSLTEAKVIDDPKLATGLLELHCDEKLKKSVETLTGILTTNHDGLFQIASHKVYGKVNLGIPFKSSEFTCVVEDAVPPIIQLHGSFTWKFSVPIDVASLRKESIYSADTTWIPPAILKESKTYPFNKLSGIAYELLSKRCDVLRVIGASLTQNDWNVLALIFNAQRHRLSTGNDVFRIELIMSHKGGLEIKSNCSYLKEMFPIGALKEGNFEDFKLTPPPATPELSNKFAYWLKEKARYHRNQNQIGTLGRYMSQILGDTK